MLLGENNMTLLDQAYADYNYAKKVKEKKTLTLDWNANNDWKNIIKCYCENLKFTWTKGNDGVIYLYFKFVPEDSFTDKENEFIKSYFGEIIIIKLYQDGHSFLGEFKSNISLNKETLQNFVFTLDAYRIPDSLAETFSKITELIKNNGLRQLIETNIQKDILDNEPEPRWAENILLKPVNITER